MMCILQKYMRSKRAAMWDGAARRTRMRSWKNTTCSLCKGYTVKRKVMEIAIWPAAGLEQFEHIRSVVQKVPNLKS